MVAPRVYHGEYTLQETVILTQLNLNMQARDLQGGFFNCSPLNLAKSQSLYKIPYSNFFSPILLLGLGLRQIQGDTVKKNHPVQAVL